MTASMTTLFETLRARYPETPFLALGQTVFWDEPMKAVVRRLLDREMPGARLIAGVHDTDYFAKTSAHVAAGGEEYVAVAHDDGRTRDLWSAAGELSALFGCESIPGRHLFLKHRVPFDWIAARTPGGKAALLTDMTAAWGWTGIVHTAGKNIIAHDVPARAIKNVLMAQLDWGFRASVSCMAEGGSRDGAMRAAETVTGWIDAFYASCPANAKLPDLYKFLLPKFYELLLGHPPTNFETTSSTELFRFHSGSCALPRFAVLGAFVDPTTRSAARTAYDRAVGGSGIYDLDSLGEGALPFDLVVPGHGRGTLRLTPGGVFADFHPTARRIGQSVPSSVHDLAALIESEFGKSAVLVGKAIVLADMIAAEHLVLFHETGSAYTHLTARLNEGLARAGVTLPLHPLVRIGYATWDCLDAVPSTVAFHLPEHMATAFGKPDVTAHEFAGGWHAVETAQRKLMQDLAPIRTTRQLLAFLESRNAECWCSQIEDLERAYTTLKTIAHKSAVLREREEEHRAEIRMWRTERIELERRKGEDWRTSMRPLLEQIVALPQDDPAAADLRFKFERLMAARERAFDEPLALLEERVYATRHMIHEFRKQRRALERGNEALAARATIEEITLQAQSARLELIRRAFLTAEGLSHTNLRPTAWWLPLVDPTGAWFDAIVERTEGRLEFVDGSDSTAATKA